MRHINLQISIVLSPSEIAEGMMDGQKFSSNSEVGEKFIEALDFQTNMSLMEFFLDNSESKSGISIMENYSNDDSCKKIRIVFDSYFSNLDLDNDKLLEIVPDILMNFMAYFEQSGFNIDGDASLLIYDKFVQLQRSVEYNDVTRSVEYVLSKDRSNNLRDFEIFDKKRDEDLIDEISIIDLLTKFRLRDIDFNKDEE